MNFTKYMYLMAAALTISACSSEDITSNGNEGGKDAPEATNFDGNIVDGLDVLSSEACDGEQNVETRSTIADGAFSSWSTTDVISISDGTLAFQYKPTVTNGTECEFGVVDGKNQFDKNLTGNENFYVFYPAAAVSGWNGAKVSSMVYAQQDYTENVDNGVMGAYMATKAKIDATTKNVRFDFKHCCSVVEVNLSALGVTPKSVSLRSNSGVELAGKIDYDVENSKISISNNDATGYSYSTKSEVVHLQNVAADAKVARFYVLPVVLKGGVTVTVEDVDGNFYTKSTSTDVGNNSDGVTISGFDNAVAAKPYYKKVNFGAANTARKGCWMSTLPGNTWLHGLSIPGAHDAATYNTNINSAKCQSKTIVDQLAAGVRAFDIRVPYIGLSNSPTTATVNLYHGMSDTGVKFKDAMDNLVNFVKNNPTETVVILVNKENSKSTLATGNYKKDYSEDTNGCAWQKSIRDYLDGTYTDASADGSLSGSRADYFITNVDQPLRLSACRGKILFLTRNYYGTTQAATTPVYGGVIRNWQDNQAFDATMYKNNAARVCDVRVQDYYQGTTADKKNYVKDCLELSVADFNNKFYINFVSMITGTLASPSSSAKEMNQATADMLSNMKGKVGIIFYDFCADATYAGNSLHKSIIDQNYKYLFNKRTRNIVKGTGTGVDIAGDDYADGSDVYAKRYTIE